MDLKELLGKMTLKEKAYQLMQLEPLFYGSFSSEFNTGKKHHWSFTDEELAATGSIINLAGAKQVQEIQKKYLDQNAHGIPLMTTLDVLHGYRTIYPIPLGIASSWDMDLVRVCSSMAAKEACYDGIHAIFAPMVDLSRDPRWSRVMESPGEDPLLCSDFARASVEGFQGDLGEGKVAACVKHFAGYGAAEAGLDYNTVDMSERTLREYYLPAYKAAVDAGCEMVMASFNSFNGIPSSGNSFLMRDILREEWGFDGVVISDYNSMWQLMYHGVAEDEVEAAFLSIQAGVDIEMMTVLYVRHLETLIRQGKVDEKLIDEAVLRVLRLKEKLNLFEEPNRYADAEKAEKLFLCEEHRALARKAAEESAVLLKNDGVLPLDKKKGKIALVGPHANSGDIMGSWSCKGSPAETVSVFSAVQEKIGAERVEAANGCGWSLTDVDESGIAKAVEIAKHADTVVLCIGEPYRCSGENVSRLDLTMSPLEQKLFDEVAKVNDNIVVLLFTGKPMDLRRIEEKAKAILCMWWPGTEGGNAAANLLFGDVVPSGKLTMCFPWAVGQCPIYYNHYSTGRPRPCAWGAGRYVDGPSVNYPLYHFGYGLSYTTFEYSEVELSADKMERGGEIKARVRVKNTGDYKAKEIVQLYIRDLVGSVVRPVKELKGYQKIELDKGEEKLVEFTINEDMLAFYGADMTRKAEKGKFRVFIGPHSNLEEYKEFELL